MSRNSSGWTPALRKEYRKHVRQSPEPPREVDELLEDYVRWAVSNGVRKIHVYPDPGRASHAHTTMKVLNSMPEVEKGRMVLETIKEQYH